VQSLRGKCRVIKNPKLIRQTLHGKVEKNNINGGIAKLVAIPTEGNMYVRILGIG
jgi:hypothetical protein